VRRKGPHVRIIGLEPFIVIMKELKLICLMLGKREKYRMGT
jgi:hypothetical protein